MNSEIKRHLEKSRIMQLATVSDNQPWVCTVYFVVDNELKIYWLSLPTRRHSQEISKNNIVAVTVPVKFELPIIGVQAEGYADVVDNKVDVKRVMDLYVDKYGSGHDFYENFVAGKNEHYLYKFTPRRIVLFDEVNYLGDPQVLEFK